MPHLSLLFARRYLFSKKSHSVINVISGVSAVAVAVPVMAMVILLSVFNGFEGLIRDMYKSFDPDILITPSSGKVFDTDSVPQQRLAEVPGVEAWSFSLEENALFEYRDRQYIGVMRGVDSLFATVVPIDSLLTEGRYRKASLTRSASGQTSTTRFRSTPRAGDSSRLYCRKASTAKASSSRRASSHSKRK